MKLDESVVVPHQASCAIKCYFVEFARSALYLAFEEQSGSGKYICAKCQNPERSLCVMLIAACADYGVNHLSLQLGKSTNL